MKLLSYLAFAGLCFAVLYLATFIVPHEEVTLSPEALTPDLYLNNAKTYADEHAYNRSLMHLDNAIEAIKNIEQELDSASRKTMDRAIDKLMLVYEEIRNDSLQTGDMNRAFMKALNALSYAEIKVSEHYLESNDLDKANIALKYGKLHIKNALRYAGGDARKYEIHIYTELDSLIESKTLTNEEMIVKLEHMLAELDTMVTN